MRFLELLLVLNFILNSLNNFFSITLFNNPDINYYFFIIKYIEEINNNNNIHTIIIITIKFVFDDDVESGVGDFIGVTGDGLGYGTGDGLGYGSLEGVGYKLLSSFFVVVVIKIAIII